MELPPLKCDVVGTMIAENGTFLNKGTGRQPEWPPACVVSVLEKSVLGVLFVVNQQNQPCGEEGQHHKYAIGPGQGTGEGDGDSQHTETAHPDDGNTGIYQRIDFGKTHCIDFLLVHYFKTSVNLVNVL